MARTARLARKPHAAGKLPTTKERQTFGKGLRAKIPRIEQAQWASWPGRPDPIQLLKQQNRERVKSLVPIRYARMLQSPFAFMRGAAVVMAHDLARLPMSGLHVNACGDCHLANFGGYATKTKFRSGRASSSGVAPPISTMVVVRMQCCRPCGTTEDKSPFRNQGQRVVTGQRIMQAASDMFLGWTSYRGHDYYVRQLRDMKASVELELLTGRSFVAYAQVCGTILARAHARSGDAAIISGYLGTSDRFDRAIACFAKQYADQTERDYLALKAAVKKGTVHAAPIAR